MKIAVSVDHMRKSDAATIAGGVSSLELMRRAGEGVFQSYSWSNGVLILCGTGNNGGDGYVLASCLFKNGISCRLISLEEAFSEDGRHYFEECRSLGIPWEVYSADTDLSNASSFVDCLFGTGFHGAVEGRAAHLIEAVNRTSAPVISVDINSGLNGDSGMGEICIRSALTVAIGSYKFGHFLGRAKDVIGSLACVDIGISLLEGDAPCLVPENSDLAPVFPHRDQLSHKGVYGYVGILGGCLEYSGAAKLANMSCAALRAGCGVATLAVPSTVAMCVAPRLLESTLTLMPDDGSGHMVMRADALDRFMSRQKAIAVGMGWGDSLENQKILTYLLANYHGSLVIDADGLNALAALDRKLLSQTHAHVILTPHLKEFERISGIPMAEIQRDPVACARAYASETGGCLLLKGACTIVTDGAVTYLIPRGCAGMATAGSGDVLSGVLVGLLGYAAPSPLTVAAAAHLTGLAGEFAQFDSNPTSMLASDTVSHIPKALSFMTE